jgi:hypothetical protein
MNWWNRLVLRARTKFWLWKYPPGPVERNDCIRVSEHFGRIEVDEDAEDHLCYWPEIRS